MHFKNHSKRLEWLPQPDITEPLGVDENVDWSNSFVLEPKPTLNEIFPTSNNAQYLSLIDVISGYHNLKLPIISHYICTPIW